MVLKEYLPGTCYGRGPVPDAARTAVDKRRFWPPRSWLGNKGLEHSSESDVVDVRMGTGSYSPGEAVTLELLS